MAAEDKRALLIRQLANEQEQQKAAIEAFDKMQSQLAALCVEAKCTSADDLPGAEERSERRRNLERDGQGLENRLRELSAGQPLAAFIAKAQGIDADSLEPQIRRHDEQIAQLNHELMEELGPQIGSEQHALELIDFGAKGADAARAHPRYYFANRGRR